MDPLLQHLKSVVENAPGLIPWDRWQRENREALEAFFSRMEYLHLKFNPMVEIPKLLNARGIDCVPAEDSDCFHGCPECGTELKTSWAGDMWLTCPNGCFVAEFHFPPRREVIDEGLVKREAVVARIREAGFHADLRESRGVQTICCHSGEALAGDRLRCVVHLIPIREKWGIDLAGCSPRTRYEQSWSLEDATEIALRILGSKFIPIADKDLEITHARVEGGDSVWMTHKPTGIWRPLSEPGQNQGANPQVRERALREIILELAWLE